MNGSEGFLVGVGVGRGLNKEIFATGLGKIDNWAIAVVGHQGVKRNNIHCPEKKRVMKPGTIRWYVKG